MKNTPLEHPDNVYISEAISQLHKELTKLNLSIKSCEMACSVSRKNLIRSKGVSRRASRRAARTFAVLKRFVFPVELPDIGFLPTFREVEGLLQHPASTIILICLVISFLSC